MRLRPALASACLLALVAAAVPARAATWVYVTGRVLDGAGHPVRGARVSFEMRPERTLSGAFQCQSYFSYLAECRTHVVAGTTDGAGRYRLPVRIGTPLAQNRKHDLVITDRGGSASLEPAQTHTHVYFAGKSVAVPDMHVWRARASIEPDGPLHRRLRIDPLPASGYGTLYTEGATVELLQGREVAWRFEKVTDDRLVDARTVEVGTTGIRAYDQAIIAARVVTYRSTAYRVSAALRPLSRGAACWTYGRGDVLLPLASCRFTDGRLGTPIAKDYQLAGTRACEVASQCGHPRWVLVDLTTPQPVAAVAVRGCEPAAAEASPEGTAFVPVAPTDVVEDGVYAGPPVLARYVRVDLAKCLFHGTEVSVFGPA